MAYNYWSLDKKRKKKHLIFKEHTDLCYSMFTQVCRSSIVLVMSELDM